MKPKLPQALQRLEDCDNDDFPAWLQWWAEHGDPSVIKVESSAEGARVVLHWPDGRSGVCAAFGLRPVPVETMTADDFIRDYGNVDLWVWHDHHSQLVSDNRTMARRKCCGVLKSWLAEPDTKPDNPKNSRNISTDAMRIAKAFIRKEKKGKRPKQNAEIAFYIASVKHRYPGKEWSVTSLAKQVRKALKELRAKPDK